MLTKVSHRPRTDAFVCGSFGLVSLWINALAVPVVASDVGSWLLVLAVLFQLIGVVSGSMVRFDIACWLSSAGCLLLGTEFYQSGTIVFSLGYGALFRRYICSVWMPVRAAQYEFLGQILGSIIVIPVVYVKRSYAFLFIGCAFLMVIVGFVAVTEMRSSESMRGGGSVIFAYGFTCAGTAAFSLGGLLLIANEDHDRYDSYESVSIAVGSSLVGAMAGAIASGVSGALPEELFKFGVFIASAIATLSLVISTIVGYCIMSAVFGISAALVIINSRAVCFNASSTGYIFIQKIADLIPPVLLYVGLTFRQLILTAPSFLSLALLMLPDLI